MIPKSASKNVLLGKSNRVTYAKKARVPRYAAAGENTKVRGRVSEIVIFAQAWEIVAVRHYCEKRIVTLNWLI